MLTNTCSKSHIENRKNHRKVLLLIILKLHCELLKRAALFWTVNSVFLDEILHFLGQ